MLTNWPTVFTVGNPLGAANKSGNNSISHKEKKAPSCPILYI